MNGNNNTWERPKQSVNRESMYGMKWHKFLIYFLLWVGAAMNIVNGILYFTGRYYGDNTWSVYRMYPKMEGADKIMGVLCIACVVLQLVTRFALAGYKAKGPKLLMGTYALGAASNILYCILVDAAVPNMSFGDIFPDVLGTVVGSVFMIIINYVYYTKREELFVN